jgi:hypothetical protein
MACNNATKDSRGSSGSELYSTGPTVGSRKRIRWNSHFLLAKIGHSNNISLMSHLIYIVIINNQYSCPPRRLLL